MARIASLLMLAMSLCGCSKSLQDQVKKSDTNIVGKTTDDIGEFDPKAKNKVVEAKVEITNPVTGALEAYGPAVQRISDGEITHALNLFNAENDRYPKDYEEFTEKIVKANRIKLPVLPGKKKYQYDVENHKLIVVDVTPDE
jgi:hypothetical protein